MFPFNFSPFLSFKILLLQVLNYSSNSDFSREHRGRIQKFYSHILPGFLSSGKINKISHFLLNFCCCQRSYTLTSISKISTFFLFWSYFPFENGPQCHCDFNLGMQSARAIPHYADIFGLKVIKKLCKYSIYVLYTAAAQN